ncbi:MAG: LytR/AlgR family response regulator transcription factor [Clostridium sp.]
MLNVYICEDNKEQRDKIKRIVSDIIMIENFDMEILLDTDNPFSLLDEIKDSQKNGVYFLDVDLKSEINGIELAEKIREEDPRGFIVFITTHAEMSYLTFMYKVEAVDYIVKDNYKNIQSRIQDCLININKKYSSLKNEAHKIVSVKSGDKKFSIDLNKVVFFETAEVIHKVNVYTENRMVEFYSKLKDIEEIVDERFVRCHRSFIINKEKIKYIDSANRVVHMNDGSTCYISVRGMKLLKNI